MRHFFNIIDTPLHIAIVLISIYLIIGILINLFYDVNIEIKKQYTLSNKDKGNYNFYKSWVNIINWPYIFVDYIKSIKYLKCIFRGKKINMELEDKNIVKSEFLLLNKDSLEYREYFDEYVEVYENCYKDKKIADITFKDGNDRRDAITEKLGKKDSLNTIVIKYIRSMSHNIPGFQKCYAGEKYTTTFNNGMEFEIEFPKDLYRIYIENSLFILDGMIENIYDINKKVFNEVSVLKDDYGIFVIDYSEKEIYILDKYYNTCLTGSFEVEKTNDNSVYRINKNYRWYDIEFELEYDDNHVIKSIKASNDKLYYLRIDGEDFGEKYTIVTYFVPYVRTSNSINFSKNNEKYYCTKNIHYDQDGNIDKVENTYRVFNNEEEEKLQKAFADTIANQ